MLNGGKRKKRNAGEIRERGKGQKLKKLLLICFKVYLNIYSLKNNTETNLSLLVLICLT